MASNSESGDSGVDPNLPHLGTQVKDLNDQFEQQQSVIDAVKEGLRLSEQQITGKEKELEEYASKLNSIKSRSRASNRSPRPGAVAGAVAGAVFPTAPGVATRDGPVESTHAIPRDTAKITPSKSLILLRKKFNENRLLLEQREREQMESKRGVAQMVEQLKTQLEERDTTIQNLHTKLSSPDVTTRLHHNLNTSVDGASIGAGAKRHLDVSEQAKTHTHAHTDGEEVWVPTQSSRITELNCKIAELQGIILGLQENLLEKDSVISARTQAIALMTEDLCRKGKITVDQLTETKEQMQQMQQTFVQFEAEMNQEKADLCEQLELKNQRVLQLEETNKELALIRCKSVSQYAQTEDNAAETADLASALAEANKQIVKLKAQTKKQLKQLNTAKKANQRGLLFQDPADAQRISDLENKITELEDEKGNLQLHLVDFDEMKVSESNSVNRLAILEEELKTNESLFDELKLQLAAIPVLESENSILEEKVCLITDKLGLVEQSLVLVELKSVHLEEEIDIISKEKATLQELLAEKTAALEYVPEFVQKELCISATQTDHKATLENSCQTRLESVDIALQTLDEIVGNIVAADFSGDLKAASTQTTLETVESEIQTVELEIAHLASNLLAIQSATNATQTQEQIFASLATQTLALAYSSIAIQTDELETTLPAESTPAEIVLLSMFGSGSVEYCLQQVAYLKSSCEDFEATLSELNANVLEKDTELVSAEKYMKQTRLELESRISELNNKIDYLESSLTERNEVVEKLESKNALQVDKLKKYAANLKARHVQSKSSEENVKQLQKMIESKDMSILELTTEKDRIMEAMQQLTTSQQVLEAKWDAEKQELECLTCQYSQLGQVFEQFKAENALRFQEAENTVALMTGRLSSEQDERDKLRSTLQEREGYIQILIQERESRDLEFRLAMDKIKNKNADLMDQISCLEDNRYSSEKIARIFEVERAKMQITLDDCRSTANDYRLRWQQSLAANEAKDHEQLAVCEDMNMELEKVNEKFSRLEKTLEVSEGCQKTLQAENDNLRQMYNESESSRQDFILMQSSLEQRLTELHSEIEALRSKLQNQEETDRENNEIIAELRSQVLKLEKTLSATQSKMNTLISETERLSSVEQNFIISSDELSALKSEMKRDAAARTLEKNLLIEELEKSNSDLELISSRFDDCDAARRKLSGLCDELTRDKSALEQEIEELNSSSARLRAQMKELVLQCDNIEAVQNHFKEEAGRLVLVEQSLQSQLADALAKNDHLKGLLSKSGVLEEACLKEVSNIITAAQAQILQQPSDDADQEWGWGSEDALLEEQHQQQTSQSVTLLETQVKSLEMEKAQLSEDLKNAQVLSGKLIKKVKELKSLNATLSSQITSSSNSLDQTMEIEFLSQISNLEKEVFSLKSEKDTLVTESHKLNTKLEGLIWQIDELNNENEKLGEEVDWKNKALLEKENKLAALNELHRMIDESKGAKSDVSTMTTSEEVNEMLIETKERVENSAELALQSEFENISVQCENLQHELEARDLEIIELKSSLLNGNDQFKVVSELENSLREEIKELKLDLSERVYEANRLSHVLLEQEKNLFDLNSKYLARDRDASSLETHLEMKKSEIEGLSVELKEHLNVIQLLKSVQNNPRLQEQLPTPAPTEHRLEQGGGDNEQLDHALYRLHQKEVRCDELTIELMQLLEERDTLQLQLSVALRHIEDMKSKLDSSKLPGSPERNPSQENSSLGDSVEQTSSAARTNQEGLANKLDQLRSVGREQRHMALQQQQRGDVALDANYTGGAREQENESDSFFDWIWGRSAPKVMHI